MKGVIKNAQLKKTKTKKKSSEKAYKTNKNTKTLDTQRKAATKELEGPSKLYVI